MDGGSARVESADFADPATLRTINEFVSKATRGLIKEGFDNLPAVDVLALVSAVYFRAGWDKLFDVADTREETFTRADGSAAKAQLMRTKGFFQYFKSAKIQAVVLPFADTRFSLVLVLPKTGKLPSRWVSLALAGLEPPNGSWPFGPGEVIVPRLELNWRDDLTRTLMDMGLQRTLGARPDLTNAITQPARIAAVAHRTTFRMDEEGAEATAFVGAEAAAAAEPEPPKPFVFRADRPFGLMVRETRGGAPLFMGYVASPSAA